MGITGHEAPERIRRVEIWAKHYLGADNLLVLEQLTSKLEEADAEFLCRECYADGMV